MTQAKQTQLLIGLIVSVVVFGLGGYFFGLYFDTKENDRLIAEKTTELDNQPESSLFAYAHPNYRFKLKFPEGWKFEEEDESYEILPEESGLEEPYYVKKGKFLVSSPTGSVFVYRVYDKTSVEENIQEICGYEPTAESEEEIQTEEETEQDTTDEIVIKGDTKKYISDCLVKDNYSRLLTDSELANGDVWHIAENHEAIDKENRVYVPYDGFYFQANSTDDLKLMDAIAGTIERF
jgi:hypothetical protein